MDKIETRSDGFKIPSLIFLVLDILGCVLLVCPFLVIHYKFYATFKEITAANTIALSPLVKILLAIHPVAIFIGILVIVAALIIKEIIIKKKAVTFLINTVVGIGLVCFIPLEIWIWTTSLSQLIDKLQK